MKASPERRFRRCCTSATHPRLGFIQLGCSVLREREPSFARVYAVRVPLRGCAAATSNCRCVVRTDKTKNRGYNVHSDVVAWWLRLYRQAADQKERSLVKMKCPIAHWPSQTQKSTCPKTDMRCISCPGTLPKRGTMSFRVTAEDVWRTARLLLLIEGGKRS